jgi:hypothetical protein
MDYPRSDRHLLEGVRRLTRIDSRSVEQVVSFDGSDDMFNFPTLYAVEVGHWRLSDDNAKQLREFLLRGGFLMVDDFHGSSAADHDQHINEWANFTEGMNKIFPDRAIEDIPDDDPSVSRFQARSFSTPGSRMKRVLPESSRIGAPFATTKAGSWSPSVTTWILATPGSIRTNRSTWKSGLRSPIASR